MKLTPEEEAKALRIQAEIDSVTAKIKAAKPGAGSAECGGIFDAYGSVEWTPSRPAGVDFSSWGDWEVWEHQKPMLGTLIPTGDWVAWNSATQGPLSGQQIGFADKGALTGRQQAEMLAVLRNEGKRTRIVSASGSFRASSLKYEAVRAQVEPRVASLEGPASTGNN